MRNYLVIAFIMISMCSFSQSISVVGNYPLIHKTDYFGIIDAQLQINMIETKDNNWEFGINLDYLMFKDQNLKNFNLLCATLNVENNIMELGSSLGFKIVADVGCFYEKSQNGLALGFGAVFDRMVFEKTQLLINIKENVLINKFNYLNFGIGLRRFI